MWKLNVLAALFSFAMAFAPTVGSAQKADEIVGQLKAAAEADPAVHVYLQRIERQIKQQQKTKVLRGLLSSLYRISPDGALTAETIDHFQNAQTATRRASILQKYLSWDLNADAEVSLAERDAFVGPVVADLTVFFAQADTNSDEIVSFREMLALAELQAIEASRANTNTLLLLFDANQDGIVVTNDVIATVDALERTPLNLDIVTRTSPSRAEPKCAAPRPQDNAMVVVLSAYEGSALSTVSIAGMDDVTHVGRIMIEAGDDPLYLFIASHSNMIWEFTGATDRLSTLVVQKGNAREGPGAGVTGIAEDRVHFVDAKSCLQSYVKIEGSKGLLAYRQAEQSIGRGPDNMLSFYTVGQVALPSGRGDTEQGDGTDIIVYNGKRYEMTPNGLRPMDETEGQLPNAYPVGATRVFRSLLRFNSGGIQTIDADAVISTGDAVEYDVMPQEAGLLQLILEEKIHYNRDGSFLIMEPINRFPSGLAGAHRVRFLLAEGVPMPVGNPSHSSVYSAETGECLTRHCFK